MHLVTSESVTKGHPDKICDQISDAILDAMLEQDKNSRVAVESVATTGLVHVVGEVTTNSYVEIPQIIRNTLANIGYTSSEIGFDAHSCGVLVSIGQQSPDIAQGVDHDGLPSSHSDNLDALGAGDQGIMFGYATDETAELFPLPALIAHRLAKRLTDVREQNIISGLRPDGKTQVTVEYDGDGENAMPKRIDAVLVSTQHDEGKEQNVLQAEIKEHVVDYVLSQLASTLQYSLQYSDYRLLVNPTGKFVIGGPQGDAGLTGRKIIVDTYGGAAKHGGGCFSGKDPSKVDRSGAYAMRWVAKNIVAAKLAKKVELQVAYAIGIASPVSININTFGTGTVSDQKIVKAVRQVFDLRPAAIIRDLDLLRPIYQKTAAYGHFGRNDQPDFTWEQTNKAQELRLAIERDGDA
jgi:S-adenosylmethionine synthetase